MKYPLFLQKVHNYVRFFLRSARNRKKGTPRGRSPRGVPKQASGLSLQPVQLPDHGSVLTYQAAIPKGENRT